MVVIGYALVLYPPSFNSRSYKSVKKLVHGRGRGLIEEIRYSMWHMEAGSKLVVIQYLNEYGTHYPVVVVIVYQLCLDGALAWSVGMREVSYLLDLMPQLLIVSSFREERLQFKSGDCMLERGVNSSLICICHYITTITN